MRQRLYAWAACGVVVGDLDVKRGSMCVALVAGYRYSDEHKVLSDVTRSGGKIVALSPPAKPLDGGPAPEYLTFPEVPDGELIEAAILFQASGPKGGMTLDPDQQRLCVFFDQMDGMPAITEGQEIKIRWIGDIDALLNGPEPSLARPLTRSRWKVKR